MTKTQVQLDTETVKILRSLGKKGESYDDVIRRFLPPKAKKKEEVVST
jgi:predicted CopG family antitoxin